MANCRVDVPRRHHRCRIRYDSPRTLPCVGILRAAGLGSRPRRPRRACGAIRRVIANDGQALSPEYYAKLLNRRELLRPIVTDTFVVSELGQRRVPFYELFKLDKLGPAEREDRGVTILSDMLTPSVSKTRGIVDFGVVVGCLSVSLTVVDSLVAGVNDFNQRRQQTQAAANGRFVESRLSVANTELRTAEDRLEQFLQGNKQFSSSPELALQRDRLQADIAQKRQLYTTLAQSYEEARIKEVRDTPVITVIEQPFAPATPEPRGRIKLLILGAMLGAFFGTALVLAKDMMRRRRAAGDANANEFVQAVAGMRRDVQAPWRWLTRRNGT